MLETFTLAWSGEQSNRDGPIFATGRHQLGDTMTKRRRDRFERFKIIFPILLAGWIPSILTLIVSYTILRDTLESRILRDRQTLIQLVGHLVGHDLSRSSSVIEYYQTLPEMVKNLSTPDPQLTQQWLNSAFYSHPQIDGMFITTANGDLVASIPTATEMIGKDFGSKSLARASGCYRRDLCLGNSSQAVG